MSRKITIDPVTRIEGAGRIEILLNENEEVDRAYFTVPELRGFESFCVGRPAEEMPSITSRICGVCPTAHHTASTKALDMLFGVQPPIGARLIRELIYMAFIIEDHLLHLFYLAGPDILQPKRRDVLGMSEKLGKDRLLQLIEIRKSLRGVIGQIAGGPVHPTFGVPGGVLKGVSEEERKGIEKLSEKTLDFLLEIADILKGPILKMVNSGPKDQSCYIGLVDDQGCLSFYDGKVRVVSGEGCELALFNPEEYANYIEERHVDWTYNKLTFLKNGSYFRVGPLARMNVASHLSTPIAQAEYEQAFSKKPIHSVFAYHLARLIEAIHSAEKMKEITRLPELTSSLLRNLNFKTPSSGIGCVEAPRGILIHHYKTCPEGILEFVDLLVATAMNVAAISRDLENIAKAGKIDSHLSERLEPIIRAYDPCLSCATHTVKIDYRRRLTQS